MPWTLGRARGNGKPGTLRRTLASAADGPGVRPCPRSSRNGLRPGHGRLMIWSSHGGSSESDGRSLLEAGSRLSFFLFPSWFRTQAAGVNKACRNIGDYLIERLYAHGVRHVFGIPGDYVLGFYDQLQHSKLKLINTCDEQGAGFAADAYARVRGLGAVCVTYCVGGLKLANTTAEAFAEKSPVVIISGAPGIKEREKNPLLHHKVREFDTQAKE